MRKLALTVVVVFSTIAWAQDIQVNRQNKTIAVTADQSVSVDSEIAVIAVGYHNYAITQEDAYRENVRIADVIISSLLKAGVPKASVETEKLRLGRVDPDEKWTPEMKKERQFEAQQSWNITLPVLQAQTVVDLAEKNGANEIEDVSWDVADPIALQAKAGAAALAKAREIAEQMAKGLGTKLGELIYASNRAPVPRALRGMETVTVEGTAVSTEVPKLTLFPQRVKSDATVYAVFAIE